jgi:EAL domain
VGIAVDDFGAGHSSLARIKALPLDALKIERAFVAEVADDERDRAVVRCVVALGDSLGLTTTAEGIETGEQLRALRRLGCTLAQGYLFARPMPAPELEAWLGRWRERRRVDPGADLLLLREGKKPSEPQPAVARAAHGLARRPPSRGDLRRASCRLVGGRPAAAQTMKSSAAAGASSVRPSR